jgi:hypothetical protein
MFHKALEPILIVKIWLRGALDLDSLKGFIKAYFKFETIKLLKIGFFSIKILAVDVIIFIFC